MKNYSVVLAMCVFLISCKKDEAKFNTTDFLDSKRATIQTFTVQAGQPINITGEKGFQIIHDGVFVNSSGMPISGDVTIRLREVTKKSEAIYNRLSMFTEGDTLLRSGGMFTLSVSQNGYSYSPQNPIQIIVPSIAEADTNMQLYNRVNWGFIYQGITYDNTSWNNGADYDTSCSSLSILTYSYNIMYCLNDIGIEWVNLDYPLYPQPLTTVNVVSNVVMSSSEVYIVFDNFNTVAHFYPDSLPGTYNRINVPVGEPVKIIVIGNSGEEAVFGKYSGVVTEDMVANINVNPITQEELEAELSAID
ncbi:MAG: hypothetical protein POELPBGB_01751 [Bacteroidia bacterium]|nr:hypothetical protein [Bacteroidia bacterium]